MPMPAVHPATLRLYDRLPEFYRDADADLDYPLLRFLSLIGDQAGSTEDLIDRVDPDVAPGSELTDPQLADPAWLPWLAQVVGIVTLPPGLTVAEQRNAITGAVAGRNAGTRGALEDAARTALTDPAGYVQARPNYQGDPFTVSINVDPDTAPADLGTVLAAIVAAGAKPAGIALVIDLYAATWATLEATYPTWADLDGLSWSTIEQTPAP